jgi:hypothetical protein
MLLDVAQDQQCLSGNIPVHIGHPGMVVGSGTFRADAGKILQITHIVCLAFLGSGMTMNGISMAYQARATCSVSGHVESGMLSSVGCSMVNLPMRILTSVEFGITVSAASDSSLAATVVFLMFPDLQNQLMLVWKK